MVSQPPPPPLHHLPGFQTLVRALLLDKLVKWLCTFQVVDSIATPYTQRTCARGCPPPFSLEPILVLRMALEEWLTSPSSQGNMQNGFQMALHIPGSNFCYLLTAFLTNAIHSTYLYNTAHLPFRERHDLGFSSFLLCNHLTNYWTL